MALRRLLQRLSHGRVLLVEQGVQPQCGHPPRRLLQLVVQQPARAEEHRLERLQLRALLLLREDCWPRAPPVIERAVQQR